MEVPFETFSGRFHCTVSLFRNVSRSSTCSSANMSVIQGDLDQWSTTVYINLGYPILLAVGTIGNTLYLLFLYYLQKRNTRTLYLAVTALSGIVILWLELPRFVLTSSDAVRQEEDFLVYVLHSIGLQLFGEDTFTLISNWTIIALSIERVLVISQPFKYRHGVPLRYGYLVVTAISVLALAVAIPAFGVFYWGLAGMGVFDGNQCVPARWLLTLDDLRRFAKILVIVEGFYITILVPLVTSGILFLTTGVLVYKILRSSTYRKQHLQSSHSNQSERDLLPLNTSGNRTLFRAILGYFVTQLPRVAHSLYIIASMPRCYALMTTQLHMQNRVAPAVYTLFLVNYAVTFAYHNNLSGQVRKAWMRRQKGSMQRAGQMVLGRMVTLRPLSTLSSQNTTLEKLAE